jgi:serine/threonine protein kinase
MLAGRYLLEKRLGRGAMGQVYLGYDKNLGKRRVAIKTVRQDLLSSDDLQEGEALARFEREAMAAASIEHPHVVNVTDFGKTREGIFYLVMEFVEGENLHTLLRREGTLSTKRALFLLKQISQGVDAAHEAGILHRDLKPANIFIMHKRKKGELTPEDGFIKVGDFGLAKIVNQAVSEVDAAAGPASRGIIGTPEFMSPEQMQPELGLDARTDVYALGTIAYLMLGGRVPFTGDLTQLIMQKLLHSPPPLSNLRSDIPPAVEKAVMRALARDVNERPISVNEFISDFENAVNQSEVPQVEETSRVVVLAPIGSEIYVDDERKGSVGSSGRMVLSSIPPGVHVLRVSRPGEKDDERVIEVRGSAEQVIQAQLKPISGSQPSPSQGSQPGSSGAPSSIMPNIVACSKCGARFVEGVSFCGRCQNTVFVPVTDETTTNQQTKQEPVLFSPTTQQANNGQVSQYNQQTNQNIQNQPYQPQHSRIVVNNFNQPPQTANQFNCPNCGKVLPANAKFCGGCGLNMNTLTQPSPNPQQQNAGSVYFNQPAPRPVEIVCPKCRRNYPAGTRFCGHCGISIFS